MSSRAESKTASQFATLTMRLKDKFHQQRSRHSERIRSRPAAELPEHTLQPMPVCVLAEQQRVIVSSLQYFKALVDRLGLDRPGLGRLDLDQSVVGGLLGGASASVLEAVQTLIRLEPLLLTSQSVSGCLARLYLSLAQLIGWADQVMLQGHEGHDSSESMMSVTTVIRAVLDGVKELVRLSVDGREGSASACPVQSQAEASDSCEPAREREGEGQQLSPPPKPSMLRPQEPGPPALPPKKRQSLTGPAPCRVAIVAPIRREPEAERQFQCEDDNILKTCSSSPAENTHCEDDPDYDFLCKDLSSSESLPPLPAAPPVLPDPRHCTAAGASGSQSPPSFEFGPAYCSDVMGAGETLSSPLSPSGTPPPLPEKKRHIHQYLQFCSSYDAPSAAIFYQRPLTRQREQDAAHQLAQTHLDADSAPSPEAPPAPALPPKRRQRVSNRDQRRDTGSSLDHQREEQEELLLTEQKEILRRISMNLEEEEGPDVRAASPDVLLVYATETDGGAEQAEYREAFLCTYRSFLSPSEVISKLQHRYRHLRDGRPDQLSAANGAFQLLLRVVVQLCTTELDSGLLRLLMELVCSLLVGGELELAQLLRSAILSKMEQRWQLIGSPRSLRPLAARGVAARPGTLLDFRSQDLAEQLTLLDSELFYKIEPPEVLLWSKEQNEEKSPNLTAFTQHFNNVSFWVRSVIILQEKPHDREKLLLKFLKVMKLLRKLNNFNSYLSILSALDSAPLRRLDWQRSTAELLEESSSLIDSSSSFRAYRAALAEVEPPCIPYLGMILQDLTFVHLGNPDLLTTSEGSKVNFSKRWQQFNILDTLRSYQQCCYSLQPDDDIISFFNDFSDHLAEEALWELSLRLRPKNTPRANQR